MKILIYGFFILLSFKNFYPIDLHENQKVQSLSLQVVSNDYLAQKLSQFVLESIQNGIPIEEIIKRAKAEGYTEDLIQSVFLELEQQIQANEHKIGSKKSNVKWYILGCVGAIIVAAIAYKLFCDYQKEQAQYRPDETRALNIQMRVDRGNCNIRLNDQELERINAQLIADIERGIRANLPCRDIVEQIRQAHQNLAFIVRAEGRGSFAGFYRADHTLDASGLSVGRGGLRRIRRGEQLLFLSMREGMSLNMPGVLAE